MWQAYFSQTDVRSVRDESKPNRADTVPVSFAQFETAYTALNDKLRPPSV